MKPNSYIFNPGAVNVEQCIGGELNFNSESEAEAADGVAIIGTLPKNVLITKVITNCSVAFNAADTNTITVGSVEGVNDLCTGNDIAPTTGGDGKLVGVEYTTSKEIKAKYAQTGTAATAGKMNIYVFFIKLPD